MITNILRRFSSNIKVVNKRSTSRMEEIAKNIFNSSVNAVKPSELITKNKLLGIVRESDREYLEINNSGNLKRFDIKGKNIKIGNSYKIFNNRV